MSTYVPGFQSFFRIFASFGIGSEYEVNMLSALICKSGSDVPKRAMHRLLQHEMLKCAKGLIIMNPWQVIRPMTPEYKQKR